MKQLLLVRHGKAESNHAAGDFSRKLTSAGTAEVTQLASQLKAQHLIPQIAINSDAARAEATSRIITNALGVDNNFVDHDIYEASDNTLMHIICKINNRYTSAMLTGHNPGFSSLSTYLSGKYINLPTAGAVLIQFDVNDWKEISGGTGTIIWQDAGNE